MRVAKGKSITQHDANAVTRFGIELRLMQRLIQEGHARDCAKLRVFSNRTECGCLEARELQRKGE